MLSTKSLGSMHELILMEQLLKAVADHFLPLTKTKAVKQLLEEVIFQSQKNLKQYQKTLVAHA